MRKALQTVALTLLIAVTTLATLLVLLERNQIREGLTPADVQTRALIARLRDGQTFRLADVYPDAWDAVQVISEGDVLTDWTWRTLRAYPADLQLSPGQQLLVFWQEGTVAFTVRFDRAAGGAPWFDTDAGAGESLTVGRNAAVFLATLAHGKRYDYFICVPEPDGSRPEQTVAPGGEASV